jgi:hypothetical protein
MAAFATSYIPSSASQVTRAADSASMIGNNFARWYNVNEGSLYAEAILQNKSSASFGIYAIDDGTTNNAFPSFYTGDTVSINARVAGSNVFTSGASILLTSPTNLKSALSYADANYASVFNGATVNTQTSGAIPQNLNRLQIGRYTAPANATIKRIAYFNRRLANSELVALTS